MSQTDSKFRFRITPSIVISLLALFIALSSSATAALVITGKDIKKHAVASKHIKPGAVKKKQLAPGLKKQLGVAGPAGAAGLSGFELVEKSMILPGVTGSATSTRTLVKVECPVGKVAISGGYWIDSGSPTSLTYESHGPAAAGPGSPATWIMWIRSTSATGTAIAATAVCVTAN